MTVDYVEIAGLMFEIIERPGIVMCDGQRCDGYVCHEDREIVYSSLLDPNDKVGFVARAVSETWQQLNHPKPLRMAKISG